MAAKDYQYRVYGQATSVYFASIAAAGVAPYTGGFTAGEAQISKDGAAFANVTNLPTHIGNGVYNIQLTATEMQAEFINLSFIDGAGANISDYVEIDTALKVGLVEIDSSSLPAPNIALEIHSAGATAVQIDVDSGNAGGVVIAGSGTGAGLAIVGGATGIGMAVDAGASGATGLQIRSIAGNNSGVSIVGAGTGAGLQVTGGATGIGAAIDAGASGAVGLQIRSIAGNNVGVSVQGAGTGAGLQALGGSSDGAGFSAIGQGAGVGFNGVSGTSHPTNFFSETIEDITGPPVPGTTTMRQGIAAVIARFYYLVTQTSTQQKQYKSDSATLVGTSTVSDDGVTQTKGRSA